MSPVSVNKMQASTAVSSAVTQQSATAERVCPQCAALLSWPDYADVTVCSSCGSTLAADAALRAMQCPQCAGPLAAVGGLRMLACCHCGVHSLVSSRGGYDRWRLPLRIDAREAQRVAHAWFESRTDIAKVKAAKTARFTRVDLVYMPIWEYSALVAGWEFGFQTRIRCEEVGDEQNERLELHPVREEVQEGRLLERRLYETAATAEAIGATRPRITGREPLLPVVGGDFAGATVLTESGSPADVAGEGRRRVLSSTSRAERSHARLLIVRESVCLLFYPLWIVERQDSRRYSMVVNGFEGSVNSAVAPAAATARLKARAAKAAPLGVLVLLLAALALASPGSRVPALALLVVALAGAAVIFWRAPVQAEVEYHDPYSS